MIDVGWAVPMIVGVIVAVVAIGVAVLGVGYFLECREVNRLRREIDEWHVARTSVWLDWGGRQRCEWDTKCADMKADVSVPTTSTTEANDE